jgi:diacylglycerol O-acyltransferase
MRELTSPVDAAWLHMDEPTNPMVVTAVLWFDEPLDVQRLEERLRERMIEPYPRFRQRVFEATSGLGAMWEDDPDFDLRYHLPRVRLPAPGGRAELEELVSAVMSEPLDHRRPLWRVFVVEGFGAGSALIAHVHHSLGDGFALANVLLSLGDQPVDYPQPGAHARGKRPRIALSVIPKAIGAAAKLLFAWPDPITPLKGPLGVRKRAAWSSTWKLEDVKQRAHELGVSINDLLMAALAGALARWMKRQGIEPKSVRAFVPVDLRKPGPIPKTLGNRFGLVYLKLPSDREEAQERVAIVHRRMERLKRSPEAAVAMGIIGLFGRIPAVLEGVFVDILGEKGSLVATNLPGPRQALTIAGARISGIRFWVPQAAHVALGISILSYAGGVGIGVAADVLRVPDPEALVGDFAAEMRELGLPDPS